MITSAGELCGGAWDGAYPSPPVDAYASAAFVLGANATGRLAVAGNGRGGVRGALTFREDQAVASQSASGVPTVGYPLPEDLDPVVIGDDLAAGVDFVVSDGYAYFLTDPLPTAPNRYLLWTTAGEPVQAADFWFVTAPTPAVTPAPTAGTAAALSAALAAGCDSPATGPTAETVEAVWEAYDGWRVETDAGAYRLPETDTPTVSVGDVLAPGSPLGGAWTLLKLGPGRPSDLLSLTLPAYLHQGVTLGPTDWLLPEVPLVVETVSNRTKVSWEIGATPADQTAFWDETHARGILPGARSLAQALDTRTNPVGDPGPESLPTVISPLAFILRELLAGTAYRVVITSAKCGPAARSPEDRITLARTAAGPYAALLWTDPSLTGDGFGSGFDSGFE